MGASCGHEPIFFFNSKNHVCLGFHRPVPESMNSQVVVFRTYLLA